MAYRPFGRRVREPLCAGLIFRTGSADETLMTRGRTHLIEHMVLSVINNGGSNGFLDNLFTFLS